MGTGGGAPGESNSGIDSITPFQHRANDTMEANTQSRHLGQVLGGTPTDLEFLGPE